jgi:putative ABC transport system permease protein
MIKNYLSVVLRNIRQSPLYAVINVFSLAIGLACCIIIYLFIKDETSFDNFHRNSENIYRINQVQNFAGSDVHNVPLTMPGMGPAIVKEFPEVMNYSRLNNREKQLVARGEKQFVLPYLAYVDSTFLEIFDFKVLAGDRSTALDEPHTMMVTESTARKFFTSTEEAMGGTLTYMGVEHKITGVLEDIPENSHLQFDVLASMTALKGNFQWSHSWLRTYLVVHPDADIKALEGKFPLLLKRHIADPDISERIVLNLQRLDDVHLGSTEIAKDYDNYRKFDGAYLDILSMVGFLILFIAGVNFTNLTTARASHRWKEIGVRTTIGAKKFQLFLQFIFEATFFSAFAVIVSGLLVLLILPLINELIGRNLSYKPILDEPWNIFYIVSGTLVLGVLTGIYPSVVMTSFKAARVLKGGGTGDSRSFFRNALVVVQFGLAVGLIVGTLAVLQQLSFMKNKDLGFNMNQMMIIDKIFPLSIDKFETLRMELKKSPHIIGVTASSHQLGKFGNENQQDFKVKSDREILTLRPNKMNIDYEYLDVYGIELKEGRNFSTDMATDMVKAFIINESLARELRLEDPVGTPAGPGWFHSDSLGTIIGVVKDFNFKSLHSEIYPLEMEWHPDWGYNEMSVKIDGAHTAEAIAFVKDTWQKHVDYPFNYSFLDEHFEDLYRSDQQMSAVLTIMAALAILISCMGLFGLAAITVVKKTKEIGIRKVLGATEGQIAVFLSRNFVLLILLSFLLASPATYWLLIKWLERFAYRISINPLLFVLGGVAALVIALVTISFHTLRCARANPVNALRYE